jgi:hypothetical protein
MIEQLDMYSGWATETKRGIALADANADEEWRDFALEAVRVVASRMAEFTSDDVADYMLAQAAKRTVPTTPNLRAMGPVMIRAMRNGWISKPTPARHVMSSRARQHNCPVSIWLSNLRTRVEG